MTYISKSSSIGLEERACISVLRLVMSCYKITQRKNLMEQEQTAFFYLS